MEKLSSEPRFTVDQHARPPIQLGPNGAGRPNLLVTIKHTDAPPPLRTQDPAQASYEVKAFEEIPSTQWDAFVDGCGEAWIYHLSSFVVEEARINDALDKSFAILQGGEIVAVCALFIKRIGVALLLTGPGPAFSQAPKRKDLATFCYARMEELANENDCVSIRIRRTSLAPANFGLRYVDCDATNYGYSNGYWGEMHGFDVGYWVISDLSPSRDDILSSLYDEHRRHVRRCQRNGFIVRVFDHETDAEKGWNEFDALHAETMTRTSSGVMSKERIDFLRRAVAERRAILYNVYDKEVCLASDVIFLYKQGAYCEAGASSKAGLQSRAMIYAIFVAMCDLKERGIQYLNIGANIPSHHDTKWGTIGDFKRRFSPLRWDILVLEMVINRYAYLWRLVLPLAIRFELSQSRRFAPVVDWLRSLRLSLRRALS